MIIANKHQNAPDDDLWYELVKLFEIYRIPDDSRSLYIKQISEMGIEAVIECVVRDLPDGFHRGRYLQKDINKRLDYVDHSSST